MPRRNSATAYRIEVEGTDKSFYRVGKWDADMKADELRQQYPGSKVTVKLIKSENFSPWA